MPKTQVKVKKSEKKLVKTNHSFKPKNHTIKKIK